MENKCMISNVYALLPREIRELILSRVMVVYQIYLSDICHTGPTKHNKYPYKIMKVNGFCAKALLFFALLCQSFAFF